MSGHDAQVATNLEKKLHAQEVRVSLPDPPHPSQCTLNPQAAQREALAAKDSLMAEAEAARLEEERLSSEKAIKEQESKDEELALKYQEAQDLYLAQKLEAQLHKEEDAERALQMEADAAEAKQVAEACCQLIHSWDPACLGGGGGRWELLDMEGDGSLIECPQ